MSQNRKRANRQNAKRSTGPKTDQGKAITRGNALRHGLRAEQITIFDERPEDFEALRESVLDTLNPLDPIQEQLVHRITVCLWRLRRIPNLEAGIFEYQSLLDQAEAVTSQIIDEKHIPYFDIPSISPGTGKIVSSLERRRIQILTKSGKGQSAYGKAFCRDIESFDALGKLSRYESQISRELFRALSALERLQAKSFFVELKPERSSE